MRCKLCLRAPAIWVSHDLKISSGWMHFWWYPFQELLKVRVYEKTCPVRVWHFKLLPAAIVDATAGNSPTGTERYCDFSRVCKIFHYVLPRFQLEKHFHNSTKLKFKKNFFSERKVEMSIQFITNNISVIYGHASLLFWNLSTAVITGFEK